MVQKFNYEILVEISVLRSPESKKVVYKNVCPYVCVSVLRYAFLYTYTHLQFSMTKLLNSFIDIIETLQFFVQVRRTSYISSLKFYT